MSGRKDIEDYMALALDEARATAFRGEVPVGAVVVDANGAIVGRSGNRVEERCDPSAHAELLAIRSACAAVGAPRIPDCDIYVTLEPCAMCAQVISSARIRRLYFGAYDPKGGGVDHGAKVFQQATCHHIPEVYGGIRESVAADLLKSFFVRRR